MTGNDCEDAGLAEALRLIAPTGLLIGHRIIAPGDEHALSSTELNPFLTSVLKVRRQSGAARIVARDLLKSVDITGWSLVRSNTGNVAWPEGIVGSLAHDGQVAIAAIARAKSLKCVGVDVEPAEPLPQELVSVVATASECGRYSVGILQSRLLFCVKEAVFKAVYPIWREVLDFNEIEIDLEERTACIRGEQFVQIAFLIFPRIVAIAFKSPASFE